MKTQIRIVVFCLFVGVGFTACTRAENQEPTPQRESVASEEVGVTASPTLQNTPMPTETVLPTATTVGTAIVPTLSLSPTVTTGTSPELVLVTNIPTDPYRSAFLPENLWWSEDSQTLFYQNSETKEAWAYDLLSGLSTQIPYVPRSLDEREAQLKTTLPENSLVMSLSPHNHYVIYRLPLPEPVAIADSENTFTFELWLHKEGQDFKLGMVDSCFGVLAPPIWSESENIAIVNTYGSPDISCLYSVWQIDIERQFLGPLETPWQENYRVLDLSVNGDTFLIRSFDERQNYLYDSTANEQWAIPVEDTDRMRLVNRGQTPDCVLFDLEFSATSLQDHIWYCEPQTGEVELVATVNGWITFDLPSPDNRYVALLVYNDFPAGSFYSDIDPGIWIVSLP